MGKQAIKFPNYNNKLYESDYSNDNNSFEENKLNKSNDIEIFEEIFPFQENSRIFEDNHESKVDLKTLPSDKKPNIFNIEKINKKAKGGRKKSGENISEIRHGKNCSDNIKEKIIRRFIQSTMNYVNYSYKENFANNKGKTEEFLKKIETDFTKSLNNKKILEYFPKTLRQFYSSNLGGKFTKMNKDYNKNNLDKLYQEDKAKDIIELMNKTLEEVYRIYISKEIAEFNLYNDLDEIKEKENERNDYIERYEKKAFELIDKYKKRKKRFNPTSSMLIRQAINN